MQLKTALIISFVTVLSPFACSFGMKEKKPYIEAFITRALSPSTDSFGMRREGPLFLAILTKEDMVPVQIITQGFSNRPNTIGRQEMDYLDENNQSSLTLKHKNHPLYCLTHNPTYDKIVTGSAKNIKIWDIKNRKKEKKLKGHTHIVHNVLWVDNNTIVSCSSDKTIKKWNPHTGHCIATLTGHDGPVFCITKNKNGSLLASGSEDKTIKIWHLTNNECITTLIGHTDRVLDVDIEDYVVASGSADCTIKLWNILTGCCTHTLTGHPCPIFQVSLDSSGCLESSDYSSLKIHWYPESLVEKIYFRKVYFALLCAFLGKYNRKANDSCKNVIYWLLTQVVLRQQSTPTDVDSLIKQIM